MLSLSTSRFTGAWQAAFVPWRIRDFTPLLPSRIPSLDGLRAVSIAFVLLSHLTRVAGFPEWMNGFYRLGGYGVRIFFVISGFLITTLLLKEAAARGSISLKNFYIRRVFRIFPAFYVYALAVVVLLLTGRIQVLPNDILHCFTYTMNYHHPHSWWVAHLWSLSVEEQFYLLWPAVLMFAGAARGMLVAAAVILIVPLLRIGSYMVLPRGGYSGQEFHLVCDALACGCLLAGLHRWLGSQERYVRLLRSRWFFLIPLAGTSLIFLERPRFQMLLGHTMLNVAVAVTIDRLVRFPGGAIGRFLNTGPLCFIGALSYSLYLWQQPFLNRHYPGILTSFPQNVICVFTAALASYFVVERPFLRLKDRFHGKQA